MAEAKKTLIPVRGSVQLRLHHWRYIPGEALFVVGRFASATKMCPPLSARNFVCTINHQSILLPALLNKLIPIK